jgi:DnaJ-domain-containing protein 1
MYDNPLAVLTAVYAALLLLLCSYGMLCLVLVSGRRHAPGILNVPAVLRELLGCAVRKLRKLPLLPERADPFELFGLDRDTASREDVTEAAQARFGAQFARHGWAYPPSQRKLLRSYERMAQERIAFREELERLNRTEAARSERRAERAREHRRAQAQGAQSGAQAGHGRRQAPPQPAAVTGWRQVLGVGPEHDAASIKQAYRKLASRAHPDRGGSNAFMAQLNVALAQAREELSFV